MSCLQELVLGLTFTGCGGSKGLSVKKGGWEGLSQHQLPLEMWKKEVSFPSLLAAFSIFFSVLLSFCLFTLSFLATFLFSSHITSLYHKFLLEWQKQPFLFNQKGSAGSCYFEGSMKDWSGCSMLIYCHNSGCDSAFIVSVFMFVCVHMLICLICYMCGK